MSTRKILRSARPSRLIAIAVLAALALAPIGNADNDYLLQRLEFLLAALLVTVGLNVVTGYAGQLSMGPGAIFALGGYTAALLADHFPQRAGLLAMSAGAVAVAAIAGLVIGVPALRMGGFYLGMVTLFIALLVPVICENLAFTGGTVGISLAANPLYEPRLTGLAAYETGIAMVASVVVVSALLLHSRLGRRFLVIATGDELPASLGIAGYRVKLLAFMLSAVPAGLGGAYYAFTQQFMNAQSANADLSIYLLAACVIGGLGTTLGPLIGGVLVMGLYEFLGGFQQYTGIILGTALAVCALVLPDGLAGLGRGRGSARLARWFGGVLPRNRKPAVPGWSGAVVPQVRVPVAAPLAGSAESELVVRDVRRAFGGVTAVDGVDLRLAAGQVHGLIGSNGSGKTTLLNLVCGFARLDAGEIVLDGHRIDAAKPYQITRLGIARTFQTPAIVPDLSVVENVAVAASSSHPCGDLSAVLRLPRARRADAAAAAQARDCLALVGLTGLAGAPAGVQPHGTRRLIEIARALALRPRFVLLDEPAAGLSPRELAVLRGAIEAVTAAGVGVLLIEHNVPFVLDLAAKVTVLHEGRRIASATPDELRRDDTVARSFLGAANV
ncbi:ATP-binding cassette domain-containing protein [Amycolatopsis rubida]|uniref:Branched-chain amino acid transport system ATP-binding protein/branched-chain amino acid transport system permease protein n=1 Tax=Amycolatopsis rubida TaxID=112413 RepID=A0A1I5SGD4_9PSEU|nr:branched-chain amino acid ABC transporter ATP-binding protein/permease [Amycolatopsis rubida]SFP69803.1 branched-chain amino acid transport system ATP-binding protein/branched-chain amino acid transport system permease protein [Amycolatopsis rubida]